MLIIKDGVTIAGLNRCMQEAIDQCLLTYESIDHDLVITSAVRRRTQKFSFHQTGQAFDIRTNTLTLEEESLVYHRIKSKLLPRGFDVVLEKDHIHIEYDPMPISNHLTVEDA